MTLGYAKTTITFSILLAKSYSVSPRLSRPRIRGIILSQRLRHQNDETDIRVGPGFVETEGFSLRCSPTRV
jgi:hypothetical protein